MKITKEQIPQWEESEELIRILSLYSTCRVSLHTMKVMSKTLSLFKKKNTPYESRFCLLQDDYIYIYIYQESQRGAYWRLGVPIVHSLRDQTPPLCDPWYIYIYVKLSTQPCIGTVSPNGWSSSPQSLGKEVRRPIPRDPWAEIDSALLGGSGCRHQR